MLGLICAGVEQDFVLVGGEGADRFAAGVDDLAVLLRLVLGEVVDRRQVLGDRGHHPEDHRDHGEDPEPEQHEEEPQLFQARLSSLRWAGRGRGERVAGVPAVPRRRRCVDA